MHPPKPPSPCDAHYEWSLLKTVPLESILPKEGKDTAAYVFARVTTS